MALAKAGVLAFAGFGVMAAACTGMPAETKAAVASETRATGELFLFVYRPGPAWRPGVAMAEQGLGPHAAYIQKLVNEGRVFAGGGFASDQGGMAIAVAPGLAEAQAMLAVDPAVTSGIFLATLEHWRPRFRTDAPLPRPA